MKYGKVIGSVWAEKKAVELKGCPLLIVQPFNSKGETAGRPHVAADPQNLGGPGDTIVYVTSTDAAEAFPNATAPVDASIVCLVDSTSGV